MPSILIVQVGACFPKAQYLRYPAKVCQLELKYNFCSSVKSEVKGGHTHDLNSVNSNNISGQPSSLCSLQKKGNSESEHFNELSQRSKTLGNRTNIQTWVWAQSLTAMTLCSCLSGYEMVFST